MTSTEHFQVETRDGIATIRYVRPPRNFMTGRIMGELAGLVGEIGGDASVRAVILTGGVEGYFVAHADLEDLLELRRRVIERHRPLPPPPESGPLNVWDAVLSGFEALPQPVLAAINGQAWGGGCEMALACDFRIMARTATIGQPEVALGIIPGAGGTQRLARLVGPGRALELVLSGRILAAEEAERIGLVHRVVEPDRLMDEAVAFLKAVIAHPPAAVAEAKQAVRRGIQTDLRSGLILESQAFLRTLLTEDAGRLLDRRAAAYREGRDWAIGGGTP